MEKTKENELIDQKKENEKYRKDLWERLCGQVLDELAVSQYNESLFSFLISGVSLGSSRRSERSRKRNRHDTP